MGMTVKNEIQYEVELVEEMWRRGWAASRTAAQGPGTQGGCDIISMRDGTTFIGNVVVLPAGTSSEVVAEDTEDLKEMKRRAEPVGIGKSGDIKIGHAVYKVPDDEWHYKGIRGAKVKYTTCERDLWRVIGQ